MSLLKVSKSNTNTWLWSVLLHSFTTMFFLLILSSFFHHSTLNFIEPVSFSFSSFDAGSCSTAGELVCSGAAAISNGYIDLTPDPHKDNFTESSALTSNVGRVIYKTPMIAWPANFMTAFTVLISRHPNWTNFGDGMAFFLAQHGGPSPPSSHGGFLGLFNGSTEGGYLVNKCLQLAPPDFAGQ